MKSTGIVRRVDELGRIVLPIELRRTLNIAEKDSLEIYVDGSSIMLKKYQPACIFCDSAKDISVFKGKNICAHCLKELLQKITPLFPTNKAVSPHRGHGLSLVPPAAPNPGAMREFPTAAASGRRCGRCRLD